MSVDEETIVTDVVRVQEPGNMSVALIEAEARAKLMKNILPHLVQVCYADNIQDFDGKPFINNDGCQKIARIAGISFSRPNIYVSYEDLPPEPEERYEDSGKIKRKAKPARRAFIVEVEGEASLLGQTITEYGGASSEDGWFNRPQESPVETRLEIRKKAMANWQGRCVRTLLGLQGLSWDILKDVGFKRGEGGTVEHRVGRHSIKDGKEDKVALDETRTYIRNQILSDVNKNPDAASLVLQTLTAFGDFPGYKKAERISEKVAPRLWKEIKPGGTKRDDYDTIIDNVRIKFDIDDEPPPGAGVET